jgi:hypothetical protein
MSSFNVWFDEDYDPWLSLDYWFDDYFIGRRTTIPIVIETSDYRKIVERKEVMSQRQIESRLWGYAPVTYKNRPTILSPGDVINMPYKRNQTSAMQALGNAWNTVSGVR